MPLDPSSLGFTARTWWICTPPIVKLMADAAM